MQMPYLISSSSTDSITTGIKNDLVQRFKDKEMTVEQVNPGHGQLFSLEAVIFMSQYSGPLSSVLVFPRGSKIS